MREYKYGVDVESRMSHIINRTGLEALNNPAVINQLLQLSQEKNDEPT